ncbi:MAG: hypothetical protein ACREBC_15190 [Pyrinomonadaceae bacterium]
MEIKRKYIIDEHNRAVAVQLDIKTFERIEEMLENYGLLRLMQEEDRDGEVLELDQAQASYGVLGKPSESPAIFLTGRAATTGLECVTGEFKRSAGVSDGFAATPRE